jgi:hypothetical protein
MLVSTGWGGWRNRVCLVTLAVLVVGVQIHNSVVQIVSDDARAAPDRCLF